MTDERIDDGRLWDLNGARVAEGLCHLYPDGTIWMASDVSAERLGESFQLEWLNDGEVLEVVFQSKRNRDQITLIVARRKG